MALTLIAATALPAPALACETVETARLDSECVVMPRGELRGVWFRLDKADELRRASLELAETRQQVTWYQKLSDIRDEQTVAYTQALDERRAALQAVQKVNELLVSDARQAREERDKAKAELGKWYRSPFLWVSVGVAVTLAGGAVAAKYVF